MLKLGQGGSNFSVLISSLFAHDDTSGTDGTCDITQRDTVAIVIQAYLSQSTKVVLEDPDSSYSFSIQ